MVNIKFDIANLTTRIENPRKLHIFVLLHPLNLSIIPIPFNFFSSRSSEGGAFGFTPHSPLYRTIGILDSPKHNKKARKPLFQGVPSLSIHYHLYQNRSETIAVAAHRIDVFLLEPHLHADVFQMPHRLQQVHRVPCKPLD